jgi:hypothetical protein
MNHDSTHDTSFHSSNNESSLNLSHYSSSSNASEIVDLFLSPVPKELLDLNNQEITTKKNTISIKDYEKLHFIGAGSYSEVYLAKKIKSNKYKALKIINIKFIEKLKF